MYKTYILYSAIKEKFYVGHTNDMDRRLLEHNKSKNLGTSDWILKYTEVFDTRSEAMKREKEIKNKKRRSYLEHLINSSNNNQPL